MAFWVIRSVMIYLDIHRYLHLRNVALRLFVCLKYLYLSFNCLNFKLVGALNYLQRA